METLNPRITGIFMMPCLLGLLFVGGCTGADVKNTAKEPVRQNAPQAISSMRLTQPGVMAGGKTFFRFDQSGPIALAYQQKANVTVQYSPTYEGISALEVAISYDPARLRVSDIVAADDIRPFQAVIDEKSGLISFVAGADPTRFGDDLPVFSFDVTALPGQTPAEATLAFVPASLHALLPDAANTETAVRENLPRVVFSLR